MRHWQGGSEARRLGQGSRAEVAPGGREASFWHVKGSGRAKERFGIAELQQVCNFEQSLLVRDIYDGVGARYR